MTYLSHVRNTSHGGYEKMNKNRNQKVTLLELVASIIIAFTGAMELVNQIQMGYIIMLLLVAIAVLRTIIFYVIDTKGVSCERK